MIRMRICPDCARKKNHYHCSHYPRGEDFVCLFLHGRNSRYKPSHIANFSIPIFCQASCTDVRKTTILPFVIISVSLISISVISVTFCCAVKIHRLRSTAQQTRNIAHHDRRRHFWKVSWNLVNAENMFPNFVAMKICENKNEMYSYTQSNIWVLIGKENVHLYATDCLFLVHFKNMPAQREWYNWNTLF